MGMSGNPVLMVRIVEIVSLIEGQELIESHEFQD